MHHVIRWLNGRERMGVPRSVVTDNHSEIDYDCALYVCRLRPLPRLHAEQMFWRGAVSRPVALRLLETL